MPGKAEFRKLPVDLAHQAVTRDLGDDAGGGDGKRKSVALDDGIMRQRETSHRQAINQAMIGAGNERFHRAAHRQMGGAQDVEAVDFLTVRSGHGPADVWMFRDPQIKFLTTRGADFFRIIEARTIEAARQDHGGGGDGAGQRTAPGLVHPRDALDAAGVKGGFN